MKLLLLWDYSHPYYKRTLSWIKDDDRVYFANLILDHRIVSYGNDGLEDNQSVVELLRRSNEIVPL